MPDDVGLQLKTIGHATLIILEEGHPILATDPWITGSAYWSSWWLERYPDDVERKLVMQADNIYITHSHPDHFHFQSLRLFEPRPVLHPRFAKYTAPEFLEKSGFSSRFLEPWSWYELSRSVRIASIPVPIDDSILLIDTPSAVVIDVNDANPRSSLLRSIRTRMCASGKTVLVLKSYAPASSAVATFKDGRRAPLKSKQDYVLAAEHIAQELGADGFIPFASQAFFGRSDSQWANEYKVTFEDLRTHRRNSSIVLYPPFLTIDLQSLEYQTSYGEVDRSLGDAQQREVLTREQEEAAFTLPADLDDLLRRYFDGVYFLRRAFRHGIGIRLTSSGQERYYNSRRRTIEHAVPGDADFTISLPDQVLCESLRNNVLTDLGITMFIRVDTRTSLRLTYGAFLLMGLHDYGHFSSPVGFLRFVKFYLPYFFPKVLVPGRGREKRPPRHLAARRG